MPAQSQQQQKLFGLALAFKRGEVPASEVSDEIKDIADRMSEKEIEDFAATKHKGLPKMKEQLRKIVREIMREKVISEMNEAENPCWKGYEQIGMKMKNGKEVPNCVPKNESVNEARIKGRNNKTGESFGMVIGSDKKNREGNFEVTIRKGYSSRISAYGFVFDKDSNLISIKDYGYSMDGKFPDMKGSSSVSSVRPNKRETITQIAKITSPAFAKKIYQHVQKNNKMDESVNEESVNEGNVKLPSSAKKFWNTPPEKLIKTYGSDLRNSIPPSQWNTHPEIIDGYGQNAGVDIFKQFIRDNLMPDDRLDPKLAKMIGIPTNVSIIDYLNDGGSGLNGNKYFKKYDNWFSALYDIYEEMEKKFGKMKAESVNEGASTEEKRIVMMAVKKIAKYRNVPLDYAVGDVMRAAQELERDIKKGKIK